MRTLLQDYHRPYFERLSVAEIGLIADHLRRRRGLNIPQCEDGVELFLKCQEQGLDQAGIVLTFVDDYTPLGVAALEKLIGKPIQQIKLAKDPRIPSPVRQTPASERPAKPASAIGHLVVMSFIPNPKRANTAGWERYNLYKVGQTVDQHIGRGMWLADVKWDLQRTFVVLGTQAEYDAAKTNL